MLDRITPVILTLNEAPNLARGLAALDWAREIVVVDSGSSDETELVARANPRVRWFSREFDEHADQWKYAIEETGIESEWILRLDADYLVTSELRAELASIVPPQDVAAYRIGFDYAVHGRRLRASLYPPNCVLFRRRARARPWQDGHTERWRIDGKISACRARLLHDDRKPLATWIAAQLRYQTRERDKLLATPNLELDLPDRLRKHGFWTAPLVFLHCLFVRGLILDGRAGLFYAWQRSLSEMLLALLLLDEALAREGEGRRR